MSLDAVKLEYKTFLETTYKQYHRMKDNLVKASESQTKMIDVQIIQFNEWQQKVGKMLANFIRNLRKISSPDAQKALVHAVGVFRLFEKFRISDDVLNGMLEKSIRMSDTPTPAPSSRPQSTKSNVRQPQGPQQRTSYTNNRNAHTNQPQQQHQQHRQHQSHGTFETSSQASTSHHGQSNTHHNHNSNNNRHDNNHASRYRNTSHQNNMYSLPSPSPLPSPSASSTVSTNSTLSTSSTASAPSSLTLTPRSWILPQIYERFWMNTKTFRDIKLQLSFKAHQNVSADPSYINHQLNQSFEQHNIRTIASGTINQVNKMYLFAHTYHESGLSSPRLSITSTSSSTPFSCQFFIELQIDIVSGHVYMKLKFKPPAQNNLHSTSQINNMANLFSTLANDTMQSVIS